MTSSSNDIDRHSKIKSLIGPMDVFDQITFPSKQESFNWEMPPEIKDGLEVFSIAKLEEAASHLEQNGSNPIHQKIKKLKKLGSTRKLAKLSNMEALDQLNVDFPNFSEVIGDIKKIVSLDIKADQAIRISPILLLGNPGIGKTAFAKRLSKVLGSSFYYISANTLTASFILTGLASQWNDSKYGKIAEAVLFGEYANPVIMMDEIDKTRQDNKVDILSPMLSLLESETAREFVDEYFDMPFNASKINWVCTANSIEAMPTPLLSRLAIYNIPDPTCEQCEAIAQSIMSSIISERQWEFTSELSSEVKQVISVAPPRYIARILEDACGNACIQGRNQLTVEDINISKFYKPKQRAGF